MKPELALQAPFCIYGAGIVAASTYTAIKTLYNRTPLFFLVSDVPEGKRDEEPSEIDGITVKRLSEWENEMKMAGGTGTVLPEYYLILAPEIHHPAIVKALHSLGVEDSKICLFTNELENELMEDFIMEDSATVLDLLSKHNEHSVHNEYNAKAADNENCKDAVIQVFQAKCHVDRALQNPNEPLPYVYPIQVGAGLTDEVISNLRDNEGDNISNKNRNYCELTATYYAWKNSSAEYKGICHYRRIFDISDGQMRELMENKDKWDVILPYPSIHYPNISMQHKRYIKSDDWAAMLRALEEVAPDYFEKYNELIMAGEKYFYNFNMLIARAEVFDDYAEFLFKVLERAEEFTTPKEAERADRFAGYMGENLTTLYFLKNRDKLKVLHTGKIWLT